MDCLAHRGFAGVNAENTVTAVRAACATADGVEVDVRRCGSGELVVVHDATVDRVTDANGRVADFTADELAALSVVGGEDGIPTFADVCATVPTGVTLHAELKETGLAADVERAVADAGCDCVVSSFEADALREVDALPRALLTAEREGALALADELDCVAVHPSVGVATAGFVERAHGRGLAVNGWTVRDPETTATLRSRGVDGVITDYPACCPSRAEAE
ncbi:MAG: glycerophosphodiester phosphodiesterase [Haloarculaceae archaeon]